MLGNFCNVQCFFSLCLENARLKGELISEQVSVDSYDIADQTDLLPDGEMEDGDVQVDVNTYYLVNYRAISHMNLKCFELMKQLYLQLYLQFTT